MAPRRRFTFILTALLASAFLAGCAAEEEVGTTVCQYESIHYENELDRDEIQETLTALGYEWHPQDENVVVVIPPGEKAPFTRVVIANASLSSGGGSVITVTETEEMAEVPGGQGRVGAIANEVSAAVNQTLEREGEEPVIEQRIRGEHLECPGSDVTTVSADFVAAIFQALQDASTSAR